jgi:hypothetical protein
MQGPIVQIVALTLYGQAALRGRAIDNFYPDNSSFAFCEYVRFVLLNRDKHEWFETQWVRGTICSFRALTTTRYRIGFMNY